MVSIQGSTDSESARATANIQKLFVVSRFRQVPFDPVPTVKDQRIATYEIGKKTEGHKNMG
jgi:hypothetical protein